MFQFKRHFRNHSALYMGVACALVVGAAMVGAGFPMSQAVLFGWCGGVALYLGLAARLAVTATTASMRQRAKTLDVSTGFISAVTFAGAVISIGAIIVELGEGGGQGTSALSISLVAATLVLSWLFQQTAFAQHYAHLFYQNSKGLVFPGTDEPDYWDFMYFSTVIGMTAQVSDVTTCEPQIRRLIMVHGIISFFFNTAILALGVNLAAGLAH
jgi:uncharacterized membrane protein